MPFEPTTLAFILFAYLWAGLVKGIAGIGYSTNCLPLLVLAVGLKPALSFLLIPSLVSNFQVMKTTPDFLLSLRRFSPLLLALLPGLGVGLYGLTQIDGQLAAFCLGIMLVGYSLFSLIRPDWHLPQNAEKALNFPMGLLTGLINGLTGSQVTPICPYLLALNVSRPVFVQTSNISFTLCSFGMIAGLKVAGLLNSSAMLFSLIGIVVTFAGIYIGNQIGTRLPHQIFRKIVYLILIMAGMSLIGKYFVS